MLYSFENNHNASMRTFAVTFTCHASKHINKKTAPIFEVSNIAL